MSSVQSIFVRLLFSIAFSTAVAAQSAPNSVPLSVEDVVKMSRSGLAEDVIITKIKVNGKPFDLSADEMSEIRKMGVSDNVIKYLLDPAQPYAPAPAAVPGVPPKPSGPVKKYPADPNAARVPAEAGLYHFQQGSPAQVDIKLLLGEKQGGGLGKVLMKKAKVSAYLVGAKAKVLVNETAPVFYLRLPEGKGIEEVVLVVLEPKNGRRNLDMGPPGAKPELKPDAMRQFDPLEVGAGLFKLTPVSLAKGEYLFYLVGTAEPPKGNYGKGYDFSFQPPNEEKKKH